MLQFSIAVVFGAFHVEFHGAGIAAFRVFLTPVKFFATTTFPNKEHAFLAVRTLFVRFPRRFFRRQFIAFLVQVNDKIALGIGGASYKFAEAARTDYHGSLASFAYFV